MFQMLQKLGFVAGYIWRADSNRGQRVRRLLWFAAWQMWKRIVGLPIILTVFNGYRFVLYPDSSVAAGFVYNRVPDGAEIAIFRDHLHLRNGGLLDIGANVGSFTIQLADHLQHAILFEPNPLAAARARENLAINGLTFPVYEVALSEVSGEVKMEDRGGVDPCNRTVAGFTSSAPTRTVASLTLDEFFSANPEWSQRITVVKIDVEGHENSVLRGMTGFLREARPPLVMFEYLERTNLVETRRILAEVGYQILELKQGRLTVADGEVRSLQNLFARPLESLLDATPVSQSIPETHF